jgi:hypothetical protein
MGKLIFNILFILTFKIMPPVNSVHRNQGQQKVMEEQYDGPYVQYKGDRVIVNYVMENNGEKTVKTDTMALQRKADLLLKVMTDIPGESFQV